MAKDLQLPKGDDCISTLNELRDMFHYVGIMIEQEHKNLQAEFTLMNSTRERIQGHMDELRKLKSVMEEHRNAHYQANHGPFACCMAPPNDNAWEAEARKVVRRAADRHAQRAFNKADANHDRELTLDELVQIEGDDAATVLREADTTNKGFITMKEYRKYKRHQALEDMHLRKAKPKAAHADTAAASSEAYYGTEAATFSVGQQVQVLRSDETWTPCTVVKVDTSTGDAWYTVKLMDGTTKECEESDLYPMNS